MRPKKAISRPYQNIFQHHHPLSIQCLSLFYKHITCTYDNKMWGWKEVRQSRRYVSKKKRKVNCRFTKCLPFPMPEWVRIWAESNKGIIQHKLVSCPLSQTFLSISFLLFFAVLFPHSWLLRQIFVKVNINIINHSYRGSSKAETNLYAQGYMCT